MNEDDYPGGWFGKSWGAPVCEPERHKPTPVGELCDFCSVPIEQLDRGHLIPYWDGVSTESVLMPYHHHCWMESILGSNWLEFLLNGS